MEEAPTQTRPGGSVRSSDERKIISNMMMEHTNLFLPTNLVPSTFSPPKNGSCCKLVLFELSFVSFNARNKIWRKIITEIKAFGARVL